MAAKDNFTCFKIIFQKNWSFNVEESDKKSLELDDNTNLPLDHQRIGPDKQTVLYLSENTNSKLFYIYKEIDQLNYLLVIDRSQLKEEFQSFNDINLPDALIIALFYCFSNSNLFNDSLFNAFIKFFLSEKKCQLCGYLYQTITNSKEKIDYNYYTLFFCFFMKGSGFEVSNFIFQLIQEKNSNFMGNLLELYNDKGLVFNSCPDRYRRALLLTSLVYLEKVKDTSISDQLKGKGKTLKDLKQKIIKKKDEDLKKDIEHFIDMMKTQQDTDVWLCFMKLMNNILPDTYWNYFTNECFLKSGYFLLCIELSSKIIIEYKLINQLIKAKPLSFNDFIDLVVKDDENCQYFDINTFQNYYMSFNELSFQKLLLTNHGYDSFDDFQINNRLKYFDILVCLLKFSKMSLEDLLDEKNSDDIQNLSDFCNKLKKEEFVDYSKEGNKTEIKKVFGLIFKQKVSLITNEFKANRIYTVTKYDKDEKTVFANCIFKQMVKFNESEPLSKLMDCFLDKKDIKTFKDRVKEINKFYNDNLSDDTNSLPIEISYDQMKKYKPEAENKTSKVDANDSDSELNTKKDISTENNDDENSANLSNNQTASDQSDEPSDKPKNSKKNSGKKTNKKIKKTTKKSSKKETVNPKGKDEKQTSNKDENVKSDDNDDDSDNGESHEANDSEQERNDINVQPSKTQKEFTRSGINHKVTSSKPQQNKGNDDNDGSNSESAPTETKKKKVKIPGTKKTKSKKTKKTPSPESSD